MADKAEYTCKHCGTKFAKRTQLANHVRYKHPKRKKRKYTRNGGSNANGTKAQDLSHHVSYIFGKVETIIEYYAASNGLPKSTLAKGVASLLGS